ncbi:hypothetical protein [Alienimonas californiensis]|uniref:Uncharacterized protein n=1 Tax=Alienimonas californiensis TaxID=2527989 RepID=A0A517PD55_9PLAN|nr:hypothetical protein [Alienimonas californiensis]QDT17261.1 hypothetical protein CA12_33750 [Alienimonas californiensis]
MSRRATILAATDEPDEVRTAEKWLRENRSRLTYVSEQQGCGCCILMWDVEGPDEVVATLPESVTAASEWSRVKRGRA